MYENLLIYAEQKGITVIEKHFVSSAKGLCKGTRIGISKKIETQAEKACVLAEELGHCFTTYGDIIDQDNVSNVKQEIRARAWAYERLVPLETLISGFQAGVRNHYELAEYLNVTESFLTEAIDWLKSKNGAIYETDTYILYFSPFGVLKKF